MVRQLTASLDLLTRALPLLLIFALVLFVNTEMWQVFGEVPDGFLAAIFAMFVALGVVFLAGRLPREVRALEREAGAGGPPLESRQRRNVALVLFISQALQVLVVALSVGAFFALFGAFAVTAGVQETWLGRAPDELASVDLLGGTALVTAELLRVAGGIAAFSGLYYAIAVLTDSTYREEFLEELTGEMRATFAARTRYLSLRAGAPPA
ncbi:MAG TPA: hypothetical protein VNB64_10885, partial [Solirubrobacteraceae bacterium]|nr:hypothetical protein [Solirubrobacteraceae bacterium]